MPRCNVGGYALDIRAENRAARGMRHIRFRRAISPLPLRGRTGCPVQQRKPMNDAQQFSYLCRKVVGKRLTYAELTGKEVA